MGVLKKNRWFFVYICSEVFAAAGRFFDYGFASAQNDINEYWDSEKRIQYF